MSKYQIWNVAKWKSTGLRILSMGQTLIALMVGTAVLFVLLGLGGLVEQRIQSSPVSSMKGFASSVPSDFFADMLGMEIPHLNADKKVSVLSGEQVSTFAFQLLTGVNPQDPKSLIAREIPGMASGNPVLLRSGSGNLQVEAPEDYQPDPGLVDSSRAEDGEAAGPDGGGSGAGAGAGGSEGTGGGTEGADGSGPVKNPSSIDSSKTKGPVTKEVLIYHSHPREAYNPLLSSASTNPNSASPKATVNRVGDYVAKRLEQQGVGTFHAQEDYVTTIQDYNWNYSYKYSRQTVKEAMSMNKQLTYLIDIHRDSQRHAKTTATINGKGYAKLYFIIGHDNKNWRQNEAFANRIHAKLEQKYPGLSRGIWGKDKGGGNNGEYNQSLSPNGILVEVGGIDNNDEELKRTSEVLADAIAEVYWEDQAAVKASAPLPEAPGTDKH